LILSFWNDSIFYIFLGAFRHLVGWVEPEGEGESGRGGDGGGGKSQSQISNLKSKID
jgi:hypothetical protein